jgi:hypothetical protein
MGTLLIYCGSSVVVPLTVEVVEGTAAVFDETDFKLFDVLTAVAGIKGNPTVPSL